MPAVDEGHKRASEPLELELQTVSHHLGARNQNLVSSAISASVLTFEPSYEVLQTPLSEQEGREVSQYP